MKFEDWIMQPHLEQLDDAQLAKAAWLAAKEDAAKTIEDEMTGGHLPCECANLVRESK